MNSTVEAACAARALLPCSESASGAGFLLVVYGVLIAIGSYAIAEGGDALDSGSGLPPWFVGGMLLPCLGAVPDAAVIAFSVGKATPETVQEMVAVGMGTLAGSSAVLLTLPWIIGIVMGRLTFTVSHKGTSASGNMVVDRVAAAAAREARARRHSALRAASANPESSESSESTESSESEDDADVLLREGPPTGGADSEWAEDDEDSAARRRSLSADVAVAARASVGAKVPVCCPWRTHNIRALRVSKHHNALPAIRCCPFEPFVGPFSFLWLCCPKRRPALAAAAPALASSAAAPPRREGWWSSDFWCLQVSALYLPLHFIRIVLTI